MRTTSRYGSLLSLTLVVLLLGGCRSEEPKPVAPGAPPPAAAAPFAVKRIDLGTAVGADKTVAAPATTFKPADTIYVSIVSEGVAPNVKLDARWTYEGDQLVNESSQTLNFTGPSATEFHIAKPDGLPAGKYKVDIAANGKSAGSKEFTVTN
jgi:hypothetical protein